MTGVTQRDTCHVSGGYGEDYEAAVLWFDTARLEWAEVGEMAGARTKHGASIVSVEDISDYCI